MIDTPPANPKPWLRRNIAERIAISSETGATVQTRKKRPVASPSTALAINRVKLIVTFNAALSEGALLDQADERSKPLRDA